MEEITPDMNTTTQPTPVKPMKPGDLFRDSGRTFQIADIEQNNDVFEIVYYTGTSTFVNSFFLFPDDTLD